MNFTFHTQTLPSCETAIKWLLWLQRSETKGADKTMQGINSRPERVKIYKEPHAHPHLKKKHIHSDTHKQKYLKEKKKKKNIFLSYRTEASVAGNTVYKTVDLALPQSHTFPRERYH